MAHSSIDAFHAAQTEADQKICDRLRALISQALPDAESKIWHAHPVWFLAGNPIVGYSRLKSCFRLMFWSGRSSGITRTSTNAKACLSGCRDKCRQGAKSASQMRLSGARVWQGAISVLGCAAKRQIMSRIFRYMPLECR